MTQVYLCGLLYPSPVFKRVYTSWICFPAVKDICSDISFAIRKVTNEPKTNDTKSNIFLETNFNFFAVGALCMFSYF